MALARLLGIFLHDEIAHVRPELAELLALVQGIGALSLELRGALGVDATRLGLLLAAAQLVPLVGLAAAGELLARTTTANSTPTNTR